MLKPRTRVMRLMPAAAEIQFCSTNCASLAGVAAVQPLRGYHRAILS